MTYEYQTAKIKKNNSPIQANAQTADTPAQSNQASEVAPPGVPGDNQTLSSGKRRLEDSAVSQILTTLMRKIFKLLLLKKVKNKIILIIWIRLAIWKYP